MKSRSIERTTAAAKNIVTAGCGATPTIKRTATVTESRLIKHTGAAAESRSTVGCGATPTIKRTAVVAESRSNMGCAGVTRATPTSEIKFLSETVEE